MVIRYLLCTCVCVCLFVAMSERMEHVCRVAVDASCLEHTISTTLSVSRSKEFVDVVFRAVGPTLLNRQTTNTVRVTGPGWSIVSVDEADMLSPEQRGRLVPIRSQSSLAMITKWSPGALTVELCDQDGNVAACVEADFESKVFNLRTELSELLGTFKMVERETGTSTFEDFRRLLNVRSPIKTIPTAACGRASVMGAPAAAAAAGGSGGGTAFVMPAWVGDIAVRWLSQCLRVHVIHHASLPNGVSRPLTLNGVYLNKISAGRSDRWRLSMVVHESSCRCFCAAWKKDRRDVMSLGTPRRVSVSIEFCGCEKVEGFCLHHQETPGRSFSNLAIGKFCCKGCVMQMSCRHAASAGHQGTNSATKCPTQMTLPCKDLFVDALIAVCRTLTSIPDEETEGELKEFLDTSLAQTMLDYATTRSVDDDTMMERDMVVSAMLETGQYFVASKKRNSPPVLQQRNVAQSVPIYLNETMQTHAHLLPRS